MDPKKRDARGKRMTKRSETDKKEYLCEGEAVGCSTNAGVPGALGVGGLSFEGLGACSPGVERLRHHPTASGAFNKK